MATCTTTETEVPRQIRCFVHGHSRRDSEHDGGEQSRISGIGLLCSHSQTVYNTKGTRAHAQRELI